MAFKLFGIAKPNTYASSWHKKAEGVSDVSDSEPEPRRRQRSERNRGGRGGGGRERGGEGRGTALVYVFRIVPEFRILRLTFHRKSASKF